jgi:hypothetical protein
LCWTQSRHGFPAGGKLDRPPPGARLLICTLAALECLSLRQGLGCLQFLVFGWLLRFWRQNCSKTHPVARRTPCANMLHCVLTLCDH